MTGQISSLTEKINSLQSDLGSADAVIQKLLCALKSTSADNRRLNFEKDQLRAEEEEAINKLILLYEGACAEATDLRLEHDRAMMESSEKYEQARVEVSELKRCCDLAASDASSVKVELGQATEEVTKIKMEYDRVSTEHAQLLNKVQLSLAQAEKEHKQQEEVLQ